jgi:hypothetical protein
MPNDEERRGANKQRKWILGQGKVIYSDGSYYFTEYHIFCYDKSISASKLFKRIGYSDTICPEVKFFAVHQAHNKKVMTEKEILTNVDLDICKHCINRICNDFFIEDGIINFC